MDTWTRLDLTYGPRVSRLSSGPYALNRTTVFDDADSDLITGASGNDWFFGGLNDNLTDRKKFEILGSI